MPTPNGVKPRLLLVEDDPTSLQFMRAVLRALPAEVDSAGSMAEAIAAAARAPHHLLLLDANLPDGSGSALLKRLRADLPEAGHVPALAHTADDSPALHEQLLADGFVSVLLKPLSASALLQPVRQWLGRSGEREPLRVAEQQPPLLLWDPAAALAAVNGIEANVAALRGIFLAELPRQHEAIKAARAAADAPAARHHLHQLKAGSGFVGALRLHAAAAALERDPAHPALAEAFDAILLETLSLA